MKNNLLVIGGLLLMTAGVFAYFTLTKNVSSPLDTVNYHHVNLNISLEYCRPYKKGRKIFGGLVPYDKYWRTGANASTEIEFSKRINFGGKLIEKGRYKLYTIPSEQSWLVVLNKEINTWGYDLPNINNDILRINSPVERTPQIVEQFTISFVKEQKNEVGMIFTWDKTKVTVPISIID